MALDQLMKVIEDEFGADVFFKPKERFPSQQLDRISTGNIELDIAYGGGLASGRVHLVSGPYSSGKTFLVQKTGAVATKLKQRVAIIDDEGTHDQVWAEDCGMDMDYVWVGRGKNAEQSLDLMEVLIASGEFAVVALDSIASLIPKKLKEEAMEASSVGLEARIVNRFTKKAVSHLNEIMLNSNVVVPTVFLINQIRMKIGVMFGSPETLPHGEGQRFFSSTWTDFRAKETIQDGKDNVVGFVYKYNIKKNKTAPPRRVGEVTMYTDDYKGLKKGDWDYLEATFNVAEKLGIFIKEGKQYSGNLLGKKMFFKHIWQQMYDDPAFEMAVLNEIKSKVPNMNISYVPWRSL